MGSININLKEIKRFSIYKYRNLAFRCSSSPEKDDRDNSSIGFLIAWPFVWAMESHRYNIEIGYDYKSL